MTYLIGIIVLALIGANGARLLASLILISIPVLAWLWLIGERLQ